MKAILLIVVSLIFCQSSTPANAERSSSKDDFAAAATHYAKGCYWHRGVRYCSSYCYVEINGKHYCGQREREAFPQGDPYALERPTVEQIYRQPRGYR